MLVRLIAIAAVLALVGFVALRIEKNHGAERVTAQARDNAAIIDTQTRDAVLDATDTQARERARLAEEIADARDEFSDLELEALVRPDAACAVLRRIERVRNVSPARDCAGEDRAVGAAPEPVRPAGFLAGR